METVCCKWAATAVGTKVRALFVRLNVTGLCRSFVDVCEDTYGYCVHVDAFSAQDVRLMNKREFYNEVNLAMLTMATKCL